MSRILLIDGYNMLHIARTGFTRGDYPVVYNFFRALKAQLNMHDPERVVIAFEGHPQKRLSLFPEYKAQRAIDSTDVAKIEAYNQFKRQVNTITAALVSMFPVSVVRHPDFEADDTIYNLIANASTITDWTVLSTDTDFIQLLQQFSNVKLYNSVKGDYVKAPEYPYVVWKAIRGDGSDNISKIPGFGDKKAEVLARDPHPEKQLTEEQRRIFERNKQLIAFHRWSDEETMQMESSFAETVDFEQIKSFFASLGFKSMIADKYWSSFQSAFERLLPK